MCSLKVSQMYFFFKLKNYFLFLKKQKSNRLSNKILILRLIPLTHPKVFWLDTLNLY